MKVSIINNILRVEDFDKTSLFKPGSISRIYADPSDLIITTSDNGQIIFKQLEDDEPEDFEEFCSDVMNWFQNTGGVTT